ncbi:Hypothetical protein NTJ_10693 [Nesidiocoris tenuis]|uniref:Uncharacterized protein n=1 Tax=Nesidiocoris tenuis TaxID=355587 RepID=A0ABN7B244_9HEMI|nr:Hypothetical protein NTJ_10693 [Nesidiocoris tenuis]
MGNRGTEFVRFLLCSARWPPNSRNLKKFNVLPLLVGRPQRSHSPQQGHGRSREPIRRSPSRWIRSRILWDLKDRDSPFC